MKYIMKLNPKYFEYMKNGTKTIEIRLNDEKRKNIKIGDEIIFKKEPELEEEINTQIVELIVKRNFNELIRDLNICEYSDKNETEEDFLKDIYNFYTKEQELKYGVVGIKISIIEGGRK
ncbi:MAG: ASCH domain-containing protein [Clostridia bacterium]|nr:ASCH domain-containing protein [Clostridia bacterium]